MANRCTSPFSHEAVSRCIAWPPAADVPQRVGPPLEARGSVGAFAIGKEDLVVAAMSAPGHPAELYSHRLRDGAAFATLTTLNRDLLGQEDLAEVEAFTFSSFDGLEVEAFLTKPAGLAATPSRRSPMIVMIHGGPHGSRARRSSTRRRPMRRAAGRP